MMITLMMVIAIMCSPMVSVNTDSAFVVDPTLTCVPMVLCITNEFACYASMPHFICVI